MTRDGRRVDARARCWPLPTPPAAPPAPSALLGLVVAWVLARVRFPGRRILDALVDVPLALPTAVAGLVYSALYVEKGWLGQWLVPLGVVMMSDVIAALGANPGSTAGPRRRPA